MKFAGIEFGVFVDETEISRRTSTTEFPFKDVPEFDDFGLSAQDYKIDAFVSGDDFGSARDALMQLARDGGVHELEHPHYGKIQARLTSCYVSHRWDEGRMCRMALTFTPDFTQNYPTIIKDPIGQVRKSADALQSASGAALQRVYKVAGKPAQVIVGSTERIRKFGDAVAGIKSVAVGEIKAAAALVLSGRKFLNEVDEIASTPLDLIDRVQSLSKQVRTVYSRGAFPFFRGLYDQFMGQATPGTTANSNLAATNENAAAALIRQSILVESARIAAADIYETRQAALAAAASVKEMTQAEALLSADIYAELIELESAITQALPAPDLSLPSLIEYATPRQTSAILIAHALYGDAIRESEILRLNHVPNPAAVTLGTVLGVLSD